MRRAVVGKSYRDFGSVRKLPSGRYQSFYQVAGSRVVAPRTFTTVSEAKNWLAKEHGHVLSDDWVKPSSPVVVPKSVPIFGDYVLRHIEIQSTGKGLSLRPSTKNLYRRLLRTKLEKFAGMPLDQISSALVSEWWAESRDSGHVTSASKAYKLLSAVMKRAVLEDHIMKTPANVRGAQNASTQCELKTPSVEEVRQLIAHIAPRYKTLVRVMTASGLRFGEATSLTWADVTRTIHDSTAHYTFDVKKSVSKLENEFVLGPPKSAAGVRVQRLPMSLTPELDAYFSEMNLNPTDLIFPSANGTYLRNDVFNTAIKRALASAGLPPKGFSGHSLRRGGATEFANKGANLAEVQTFLGDSSPSSALRYIKDTDRQADLIERMEI
jgi:integrase